MNVRADELSSDSVIFCVTSLMVHLDKCTVIVDQRFSMFFDLSFE